MTVSIKKSKFRKSTELPELMSSESIEWQDFERWNNILKSSENDFAKRSAVITIGTIASYTYDEKLIDECVTTIGEVLTADRQSTTLREAAAYGLGLTGSPKALNYLEKVLRATDTEKETKYPTTVRAQAVQSLGKLIHEVPTASGGDNTRDRIRELLEYVAEYDNYDPKRIAMNLLSERK